MGDAVLLEHVHGGDGVGGRQVAGRDHVDEWLERLEPASFFVASAGDGDREDSVLEWMELWQAVKMSKRGEK